MNNKINLDNTQLRQYIQLLEGTGASREILGQFFQETYGVNINDFNTQYNLCNSIEIDNMKHKLESEKDSDIDVEKVFNDESEINLINNEEVWSDDKA